MVIFSRVADANTLELGEASIFAGRVWATHIVQSAVAAAYLCRKCRDVDPRPQLRYGQVDSFAI
jgi:hypothetical protein